MKEKNPVATSIRQQLQNLARERDESFDSTIFCVLTDMGLLYWTFQMLGKY